MNFINEETGAKKGSLVQIGGLYIQRKKEDEIEGHIILPDSLFIEDPIAMLEAISDWKMLLSKLYADLYLEQFGEQHDS